MQKNPHNLTVPLSLAQIHLSKNAFAQVSSPFITLFVVSSVTDCFIQALAVLEGLSDEYKFKPGVVATISALYEKAGDVAGFLLLYKYFVLFLKLISRSRANTRQVRGMGRKAEGH